MEQDLLWLFRSFREYEVQSHSLFPVNYLGKICCCICLSRIVSAIPMNCLLSVRTLPSLRYTYKETYGISIFTTEGLILASNFRPFDLNLNALTTQPRIHKLYTTYIFQPYTKSATQSILVNHVLSCNQETMNCIISTLTSTIHNITLRNIENSGGM